MFTLFGNGSTPAIRGEGAIAVMEKIRLGGVEQWVAIRGHDTDNPLLLWVHGGPGGAMDTAVLRRYAPALEEHYTVVTWNQRGAVKSYSPDLPAESMTISQFLSDLHELVTMLTRRFQQRKVYLAAHSVGTIFGLLFAQRHPELVHAYIGVNQVIERAERSASPTGGRWSRPARRVIRRRCRSWRRSVCLKTACTGRWTTC
jgi:pimeloyl-ACP methyl ester carboxylesterase